MVLLAILTEKEDPCTTEGEKKNKKNIQSGDSCGKCSVFNQTLKSIGREAAVRSTFLSRASKNISIFGFSTLCHLCHSKTILGEPVRTLDISSSVNPKVYPTQGLGGVCVRPERKKFGKNLIGNKKKMHKNIFRTCCDQSQPIFFGR